MHALNVRAHHGSLRRFHLDLVRVVFSEVKYSLHPAVLDLVMVVAYYRVKLT